MTGEEFRSRYELGEPVGRGRVASFRARVPDGSAVMVHFLTGDAELDRPVLERLDASSDASGSEIRARFEVDGRPVVVTVPLEPFNSFEEWLDGRVRDDGESGAGGALSSVPPQSPGQGEPGEFTRLFEAHAPPTEPEPGSDVDGATSEEASSPEAPAPEKAPSPSSAPSEEASTPPSSSEQTSTPSPGSEQTPPRPPAAPEETPTSGAARPSEGRSPARGGAAPDSRLEPDSENEDVEGPGEFTRLFQLGQEEGGAEVQPPGPPPARPPLPDPPVAEPPGAEKRPPDRQKRNAPDAGPPPRRASEEAKEPPRSSPYDRGGAASSSSGEKEPPQGPGEFTRMFGAGGTAPEPPAQPGLSYGGSSDESGGAESSRSRPGGRSDAYLERLRDMSQPPEASGSREAGSPGPPPASAGGAGKQEASPPPMSGGSVSQPRPQGPGEFTRIIGGGQGLPSTPPGSSTTASGPAAAPPTVPEKSGRRPWIWLLVFGGILVAALLLVVLVVVLS